LTDPVLKRMSPAFDERYSWTGRPSIPPEYLLRALVLQPPYSIRSERLLMEEIEFHLGYRWFVGLRADEPVVGCDGVFQESGTAAETGRGPVVL
jgi:transposase